MTDQRELLLRLVERRTDIDGRFEGIRRIGADGGGGVFSLLFQARDRTTGQDIALKVLKPDVTDTYRRQCFVREEQLLGQFVGQPDIIGWVSTRSSFVETIPTVAGIPLTLEFQYYGLELASTDLEQLIYGSATPFAVRVEAFRQGCRGLQRLHAAGMAHRDLKPSNMLIMRDGTARLSDLGTSRLVDGSVPGLAITYGGPPGDTRYAAPDLTACLHDVNPRYAVGADFYTLGSILFEISTAQLLNPYALPGRASSALAALRYVGEQDRVRAYLDLAQQLEDRDMPRVRDFDSSVPRSVAPLVDALYRDLTRIDFRERLTDFRSIFRRVDAILFVIKHAAAVARWRERRRQLWAARQEKERRRAERRSIMGRAT
jgi:serine/threonine protein kinase